MKYITLSTIFRLHELLGIKIIHDIPITWSTWDKNYPLYSDYDNFMIIYKILYITKSDIVDCILLTLFMQSAKDLHVCKFGFTYVVKLWSIILNTFYNTRLIDESDQGFIGLKCSELKNKLSIFEDIIIYLIINYVRSCCSCLFYHEAYELHYSPYSVAQIFLFDRISHTYSAWCSWKLRIKVMNWYICLMSV